MRAIENLPEKTKHTPTLMRPSLLRIHTPLDIQGPITRVRARQLNLEVSSFLSNSFYDFENRLLPNDYIMLRNQGEDPQGLGEGLGGVEGIGPPIHRMSSYSLL